MRRFIRILLLLFFFSIYNNLVLSQTAEKDKEAKDIMIIRQKQYTKKNKTGSCEELKDETKKLLLVDPKNVEDLDPLISSQWDRYLKCPQTDWESVLERSAVELYKSQVMLGIKKLNIFLPEHIIWSPSNCPCFNASATNLGASSKKLRKYWLIEINNSLGIAIGEYAKIAALITPIHNQGDQIVINPSMNAYINSLSENQYVVKQFLSRLAGHILNIPTIQQESISIGNPYLSLYAEYSINAQIFALAHEISHVILKHDYTSQGLVTSHNGENIQINVSSFTDGLPSNISYKQEYAADSLGLEIMLAVLMANIEDPSQEQFGTKFKSLNFGIYGAEMLITWMELFQNAEIATYGSYNGIQSHPPASERRERIRRILKRKSLINSDQDFGKSTHAAMLFMWEKLKPEWDQTLLPIIKSMQPVNTCRTQY